MNELTYLTVAGIVDVILLTSSAALLYCYGKMSLSHPAPAYLVAHAYMVTVRTMAILGGQVTCFSSWDAVIFRGVTEDEILRAVVLFDVVLVGMTLTWLIMARRQTETVPNGFPNELRFNPNIARPVAFAAAAIGLLSMLFLRYSEDAVRTAESWDWERSSWLMVPQSWLGLACLCLIYWYGFRPWLTLPLLLTILDMSTQGYHRNRVFLPAILWALIYLDRRKLKWPPLSMMLIFLVLGVLFFPMKVIGRNIQRGGSSEELVEDVGVTFSKLLEEGGNGDLFMLDAFAVIMTSVDEYGSYFWGTTYLPLVTMIIPRPWWPDKPALNFWCEIISTPDRPVWECGMASTLLGESYANFGLVGVLVIPCLWAYLSGRFYFWAYRHSNSSLARFGYLVFACNFIQVYRDGLMSAFVFPVVCMMPMAMVILCHLLSGSKTAVDKEPPPRNLTT